MGGGPKVYLQGVELRAGGGPARGEGLSNGTDGPWGWRRRAEAVLAALTTKYAVPAGLRAYGSGPYAPVASNDSEDGRAKNRRVELVKQ